MKPIELIVSKLLDAKRNGTGWTAKCPAHDDGRASLSVGVGEDGRALLHCHAGCSVHDICTAMGITEADLFPNSHQPKARARIVATYPYHDEQGAVLYEVVRYVPKDFRQRRPDAKGGWVWNMKGVRRVLYRLPDLIAADKDRVVFIAEGEKDVGRLVQGGLVATCNVGGAGKWRQQYNEPLRDRRVVVIADRDKAGRDHARTVAKSLHGVASEVRVLELPGDGIKDASDWCSAGGTAARLMDLAEQATPFVPQQGENHDHEDPTDNETHEEKVSQAEQLVRLALELHRIGQTDAGEPFAVAKSGPNLALMFRGNSDALRSTLAREFRRRHGKTPNASALSDALTALQGEAMESTPEAVHLRLAEHDGGVVLDLGRTDGKAVMVRPDGWDMLDRSPVLFRRTALTGAMPLPVRDGSLADLRSLLNVSEETWPFVVGWLVSVFIPSIPHPILEAGGEQGTGKSTMARMLVNLVDPSPAPLRSEPRDLDAWAVAASGSWIVGIDNVSGIPAWFSDVLCRSVTGDGVVKRKLYSDSDLAVLSFRRCVVLTSIDAGALRGDLGERLLLVDLERIPEDRRRTEAELDAAYAKARPAILGAVLDKLVAVLRLLPTVNTPTLPRMADFGRVLAAMDAADGPDGPDGRSLPLYLGQAGRIASDVIEGDPVAAAVVKLVDEEETWTGTARDLLAKLSPERPPHGWPGSPRAMAGRLKRVVPALLRVGIEVNREREASKERTRLYTVRRKTDLTVQTVQSSAIQSGDPENPAELRTVADDVGRSGSGDRPAEDPVLDGVLAFSDGSDDLDGSSQLPSEEDHQGDSWGSGIFNS